MIFLKLIPPLSSRFPLLPSTTHHFLPLESLPGAPEGGRPPQGGPRAREVPVGGAAAVVGRDLYGRQSGTGLLVTGGGVAAC